MADIFQQQPITVKEIRAAEKAAAAKRRQRRRQRIGFPTPNFYLFAFALNLAALLVSSMLLTGNLQNASLFIFGLLATFGLGMAVYSTAIKPVSANFSQRRRLVGMTTAYGFVLLTVQFGVYVPAGITTLV